MFSRDEKSRLPHPSKFSALEFKHEFRRFKICTVSATIGIDWSICHDLSRHAGTAFIEKRPSGPCSNDQQDENPAIGQPLPKAREAERERAQHL